MQWRGGGGATTQTVVDSGWAEEEVATEEMEVAEIEHAEVNEEE
jgi:hypothetical protein